MILLSMILPAALVCLVLLYGNLLRRFFRIRAELPVLGLRDGLGQLTGKKKRLAALGALFFAVCFLGQLGAELWSPDMLMVFNYEEAARGQNPNVTRFNESNILSDHILEQVIRRGDLKVTTEQLSELLTISTPLDAEKLDVTQESDLKISTEYRIHCSEKVSLYHTSPKVVLNLLADVYWEDFVHNYAENDSILDLSFQELDGMEYVVVEKYVELQARKLRKYLAGESAGGGRVRAPESGETFASLSQKIDNFIEIELERYEALVLENGLSRERDTYRSRMEYANRVLETERRKDMAAHDVRIEAIEMYNAFMTDTNREFYMSRTKVGVDYFAAEAKEHLASAAELGEEMEHNTYASQQIGGASAASAAWVQADQRIGELKEELLRLSDQCRELCGAYVQEKRDGYIQVCFTTPSLGKKVVLSLLLTMLFTAALAGNSILKRDRSGRVPRPRKGAGAVKETQEVVL